MFERKVNYLISHWYYYFDNLQESSQAFYEAVELALGEREAPNIYTGRTTYKECGFLSDKREYLRVEWKEYIFDICAAPFGRGFFISWWLGESFTLFQKLLLRIPLIGPYLKNIFYPITYYRIDTALMFQCAVHNAVQEVLDKTTDAYGLRALSENERKPILRELVRKM